MQELTKSPTLIVASLASYSRRMQIAEHLNPGKTIDNKTQKGENCSFRNKVGAYRNLTLVVLD